MARNPNIAVIKIGYHSYAFEDAQQALEFMVLMSKAVQVEEDTWNLRDLTPCTHFLADESQMPEMKFVSVHKFNGQETVKEFKERDAREKSDRADMDQQFRETPIAIAAPQDDYQPPF